MAIKKSDLYSQSSILTSQMKETIPADLLIARYFTAERFATPLPQLTDEVATLAASLDEHLKKMGAVWK